MDKSGKVTWLFISEIFLYFCRNIFVASLKEPSNDSLLSENATQSFVTHQCHSQRKGFTFLNWGNFHTESSAWAKYNLPNSVCSCTMDLKISWKHLSFNSMFLWTLILVYMWMFLWKRSCEISQPFSWILPTHSKRCEIWKILFVECADWNRRVRSPHHVIFLHICMIQIDFVLWKFQNAFGTIVIDVLELTENFNQPGLVMTVLMQVQSIVRERREHFPFFL